MVQLRAKQVFMAKHEGLSHATHCPAGNERNDFVDNVVQVI